MKHYCPIIISVLSAVPACSTPGAPSSGGGADDAPVGTPEPPAALCADPQPLAHGDALWAKAPFEPPTQGGPSDDDSDDGDDDEPGGAGSFLVNPDGGSGGAFECDLWAQDCPRGEKCMPWANDASGVWNATRCSEVDSMPGMSGDACTAEGSPASGIDSCELGAMCWDVDRELEGSCASMCGGSPDMPACPDGSWCFTGYDGNIALCLDDALCVDDGACRCMCPEGTDPDCSPEQCMPKSEAPQDDPVADPPEFRAGEAPLCPDTFDPVVMYMSNDDSNSQASPILARRLIHEGIVVPLSAIRIHEFMNYFEFPGAEPEPGHAAKVSMQMRRTNADLGEFTLVLNAQAKTLTDETRPPMNIVFSLDTSGSMSGLPIELLRDTLTAAAGALREGDVVSAISWTTVQDVILDGHVVTGPNDPTLMTAIAGIDSGGGTDLHAGLVSAYQLANTHLIDDGINRVVLVSDGGANVGVTDIDLIASEASGENGGGIYMVGVGVGTAASYRDDLMDQVTDAGKGAYIYIDEAAEANKQFGVRFVANMAVAARDVRMKLTLPWYFGIKTFHGEEFSSDPTEVEPQHLAPNDSMTFHQIVAACDPSLITTCDEVTARVDYLDPLTGAAEFSTTTIPIDSLVAGPAELLRKADVVVGYAKALIVIAQLAAESDYVAAHLVATNMEAWARAAAEAQSDPELDEIADLMEAYAALLSTR